MSQNLNEGRGGSFALGKAGLAEGTNPNTIQITNITDYSIEGVVHRRTVVDNIAMTALPLQADLTTCLYGIDINAAGAVTMVKGQEVPTARITSGELRAPLPDGPSVDRCRIGILRIVLTGATFTSGTTDLGAANVVDTFFDTLGQPASAAPFA